MRSVLNGKHIIQELEANWRDMITAMAPTGEIAYRVKRLILRLQVVTDKIYIKTIKARDMLLECTRLSEQFSDQLNRSQDQALQLLTRIEGRVDELVKNAHEFRIKAG